ncbi:uncharacterized protein L969DRAFT_15637 [Mixia osmundae IAM 14324]|nr:uncharacterized protein L969DRAFT_15637 [Mixia osmundae IAM 14324]KEI41612.1 hypothetical protein L969DRAFT_15637 [Mixia osmundae IAM 14324]
MISLLAGKPNPDTFPFEQIDIKLKPQPGQKESQVLTLSGKDLDEGLQYGPTKGLTRLVKWFEGFLAHVHDVPLPQEGDWAFSMGSGSQDVLIKAMGAVINPGDTVLVEAPTYPGGLNYLWHERCNLVECVVDGHGLVPDNLESVLDSFARDQPNAPKPKVLYTIPTGSNPAGSTLSEDRKVAILKIAKKHDLLILEDDPYYFLYFGPKPQPRSFFSLEQSVNGETGRVLRFDSVSKILSSGIRLGSVCGHKSIIERIELQTANTNLQVPSLTQAIALQLVERWQHQGFIEHCTRVAEFYKQKRDVFDKLARKHLEGVAQWDTPEAGLFLWIKLLLNRDGSDGDSESLIREKAVEKGVLCVPGVGFMGLSGKTAYVRVSFSLSTEAEADEAFRRLRSVIDEARSEQG